MRTAIRKPMSIVAAALIAAGVLFLASPPAQAVVVDNPVFATGAGPGAGAHGQVVRGEPGNPGARLASFSAYAPNFIGGVDVVLADLDADGVPEIVTGAGPGAGPHVRAFELDGTPIAAISFAGYSPGFTGGVHVGAADVNGDGDDEIVLGAGAGAGSHLRVFDFDDTTLAPTLVCETSAYGSAFRGGVYATGIFLGAEDTEQHIVTSAGPGGGAHVRIFKPDCTPHATLGGGFNAYPVPGYTSGANVDTADTDADGIDEIITIALVGSGHVRSFKPDGTPPVSVFNFAAYPSARLNGNDVGAMFADATTPEEGILTGAGRGASAHVRSFNHSGGTGPISFNAYPGHPGGVTVSGGLLSEDVPAAT